MNLVVLPDIFGRTDCFDKLVWQLSSGYEDVVVIDPYDGVYHEFADEQEAYTYFMNNIGVEGYAEFLSERLNVLNPNDLHLLGFSVGASAIWSVSEKSGLNIASCTCFYSSQIRKMLDIKPNFSVDLIFANREPAYDVDEVIDYLSATDSVNCIKSDYLHGFMNEKSLNFNPTGYAEYLSFLKERKPL